MSSPTEKHREIAKVIYDALGRGSTRDEEVIARALAKSEREGMKRAAEIARSHIPFMPHDGPINEAHRIEYEALGFAMQAILAEAGEAA